MTELSTADIEAQLRGYAPPARPGTGLTMEQVYAAWKNRGQSLRELDRLDAEESLKDYTRLVWPVIEPGRELAWGWVMDGIVDHLEAVTHGHIRKLLINVPPGFMKSLQTDVLWPSWEWGPMNRPHYRYVSAAYSQHLTIRDNNKTRNLIKSPIYQELWGSRFAIDPTQDAKVKFANDKTGFKLATSVGGVGTGERGDRVIIDDPHNVLEGESDAVRNEALQWFTEVMPTRVNEPMNAIFVVIMQRVHELDVSGLILEHDLGYEHFCVPMHFDPLHPPKVSVSSRGFVDPRSLVGHVSEAQLGGAAPGQGSPAQVGVQSNDLIVDGAIAATNDAEHEHMIEVVEGHEWHNGGAASGLLAFPERYNGASVTELEKAMMAWGGTYSVSGQLEQAPTPRGGGMLKADWFEICDRVPDGYKVRCRGWDFAGTEGGDGAGTASVLTTELFLPRQEHDVGETQSDIYIEDATWDRLSPGQLYEFLKVILGDPSKPGSGVDPLDVFQSFPQDPAQAGKYQVNDMLSLMRGRDFEFSLETGEKEVRMRPFAAQAETRAKIGRKIKLVRGNWNKQYLDQITKFPKGRLKDIPDAQSRSYGGVVKRGGGMFQVGGGSVLLGADGTTASN